MTQIHILHIGGRKTGDTRNYYPFSGPKQMPLVEPLVKYGKGIHGIK